MMLMAILVIILFIFLIGLLVWWWCQQKKTHKEGWEDYVESIYQKYLLRPLDVVMEHFYQDKDISFVRADLRNYIRKVKQGRKYMETKSVAVVGLLRDCKENIPHLQQFYQHLSQYCKDTLMVIVENDSTDGTREALLDWHRTDPSVTVLCATSPHINQSECATDALFSKQYSKTPSHHRIHKMAYLRNVYLRYLQKLKKPIDHVLVMDLDLKGNLFLDGLCHTFAVMEEDPRIEAVACNGMMRASCSLSAVNFTYYDSFAYVLPGEEGEWNTLFDKRSHDDEVIRYTSKKYLQGTMELDPVRSSFCGACVYRASALRNTEVAYSFSSERYVCEHTKLHQHLQHMVVNPRMLFLIEQNLR